MNGRRLASTLILSFLLSLCVPVVQAQTAADLRFDENGNGLITTAVGSFPTLGILAPDPGPGGLALALTYSLLMPPSLVVGDLLILEIGGGLSDVIRFNPTGQLVFYSDTTDGLGALADTGFPTAFYANTFSLTETSGTIFYVPAANQPGFVPGFQTRYTFISDEVPEPATLAMLGLGLLTLGATRRRTRPAP